MRVIIAGGRDYQLTDQDYALLAALHTTYGFMEVVSGGATGADTQGAHWAQSQGLPVQVFQAAWKQYGREAGPIRNNAMLAYMGTSGLLIAFPGGKGTARVRQQAQSMGIRVLSVTRG